MREVTIIRNGDLLEISWSRGRMTCTLGLKHVQNALKKVSRSRIGRFIHDDRTCKHIIRDFTRWPNGAYALSGNNTCFLQEKEWLVPTSCGCED